MLRLFSGLAIFAILILVPCSGCGGPDHSKDPDFNPETKSNPGAIKMDASIMKKPKK